MIEETEPLTPVAPPPIPEPEPRKRYGSFYEAWPNVPELRKLTQRHGIPRLGLDAEGQAKAQTLIDEFKNG